MKSLFNGLGSGFGRTIGRIIAYLFIGIVLYFLLNSLDIDIIKIIKKGGLFL